MADEVKLNISIDESGGQQSAAPSTPSVDPSASASSARKAGSTSQYRRNSAEELAAKEAAKTEEKRKRAEIEIWRAQQLSTATKTANEEQRAFDNDQTRNRRRLIRARLGGQNKNIKDKAEGQLNLENAKQEGKEKLQKMREEFYDKKRENTLADRAARQAEKERVSKFNFIKSAAQFLFNPTAASARQVAATTAQWSMNGGGLGGAGGTPGINPNPQRKARAQDTAAGALLLANKNLAITAGVAAAALIGLAIVARQMREDFGYLSMEVQKQEAMNKMNRFSQKYNYAQQVGDVIAAERRRNETNSQNWRSLVVDFYRVVQPAINAFMSFISFIYTAFTLVIRLLALGVSLLYPIIQLLKLISWGFDKLSSFTAWVRDFFGGNKKVRDPLEQLLRTTQSN